MKLNLTLDTAWPHSPLPRSLSATLALSHTLAHTHSHTLHTLQVAMRPNVLTLETAASCAGRSAPRERECVCVCV